MRAAIKDIVKACKGIFGEYLLCVILKGSGQNHDFVPDYSDIDIHAYVEPRVLEERKSPKLEYVIRFQEAIGRLDPKKAGVSQFQVYFLPADRRIEGWNPPVPGTYEILHGAPVPAMQMTSLHEYLEQEWRYLSEARRDRLDLLGKFVDKPNSSISGLVRLTGTCLKGLLYAFSCVLTKDPGRAFSLTLDQMLSYACEQSQELSHARSFFDAITNWGEIEKDPRKAREAFALGIRALEAIERWQVANPKRF